MENIHELLVKRHSIRRYTDQPIDAEHVRLILEAALLAPTSKSSRPWQFIVVDDKELLAKMAQCRTMGTKPIENAAFAVVVAADTSKSDVYIEDCSIAAAYMQLQATDLGLGACWVQVRDRYAQDGTPAEEILHELLGMPENMPIECVVTFGHPDEQRKPVDTSKLLWEKVHIGQWKPVEE
jgi:nitroreductase